jgi:hypothetical protein
MEIALVPFHVNNSRNRAHNVRCRTVLSHCVRGTNALLVTNRGSLHNTVWIMSVKAVRAPPGRTLRAADTGFGPRPRPPIKRDGATASNRSWSSMQPRLQNARCDTPANSQVPAMDPNFTSRMSRRIYRRDFWKPAAQRSSIAKGTWNPRSDGSNAVGWQWPTGRPGESFESRNRHCNRRAWRRHEFTPACRLRSMRERLQTRCFCWRATNIVGP